MWDKYGVMWGQPPRLSGRAQLGGAVNWANGGQPMKICAVVCSSLVLAAGVLCQSAPGYRPKTGFVPDSKTAVAIAEAVLIPVYGKEHIESERPFNATLKQDVWTIEGTLNCFDVKRAKTTDCDGGVAVVKISKDDGRILYMLHSQ
jgi:hypothetical protein